MKMFNTIEIEKSINLKLFIAFLVNISIPLSLVKFMQNDVTYEAQSNENFLNSDMEISNLCEKNCSVTDILNTLNGVFNNVIFLVINLIVDFVLYLKLKKYNQKFSKFRYGNIVLISVLSLSHLNRKLDNFRLKKEKQLGFLIIWNGIVFFILRCPESILFIFLLINKYQKPYHYFCSQVFECDKMYEILELFYILTYIVQFYLFKSFNSNIKKIITDYYKIKCF